MLEIAIATGQSRESTQWENVTPRPTWEQIALRCTQFHVGDETTAQYHAGDADYKQSKKDVGGFVSGMLAGGRRKKEAVLEKQILTLDADYGEHYPFVPRLHESIGTLAWMYYTTHSHTASSPRYRLLIPTSRPMTPEEYPAVARYMTKWIGIEAFDRTCYDLNRLMYWPSHPADSTSHSAAINPGTYLDVDYVLSRYADWHDISQWPRAQGEILRESSEVMKLGDPRLKPGVIGLFCQMFPISRLFSSLLKDVYFQGANGRYTFALGTSSNGVVVYDDVHVFSHHNTDPAGQQTCNAFDLVRLHLFGADADNEQVDMGRRESFKNAAAWIREIPEVKKRLVTNIGAADFFGLAPQEKPAYAAPVYREPERAQPVPTAQPQYVPQQSPAATAAPGGPTPALPGMAAGVLQTPSAYTAVETEEVDEADEWKSRLVLDKQSKAVMATAMNLKLILNNDPRIAGCFGRDIFAKRDAVKKLVPWQSTRYGNEFLNDTDVAYLRAYLETAYGLKGKEAIDDALLINCADNQFHPVRDYLDGVGWDGVPRAAKLFHYFLGVEDSEYSRAVTMKWLCAAVARVYMPGIKFDNMLIFTGEANIGKSYVLSWLGGKWFSDTAIDLRDMTAAQEAMQGVWIMEWGELTNFRTGSIEAVKGFVSKQTDRFRAAYARRTEDHPRQTVLGGSTNLPEYLSDPDGNRKFWTLHVMQVPPVWPVGFQDSGGYFSEELRAQIWAEAKHYLMQMRESLLLNQDLRQIAAGVQLKHTEVDPRYDLVREYVDMWVPADWYKKSKPERMLWLLNPTGGEGSPGFFQRDKITKEEIWVEAFKGNEQNFTKINTRFIEEVMRNWKGWKQTENPIRVGVFARSRGWNKC